MPKNAKDPKNHFPWKKAGALLDNIKEDRAKVLQFQMRDKEKNTRTRKNW